MFFIGSASLSFVGFSLTHFACERERFFFMPWCGRQSRADYANLASAVIAELVGIVNFVNLLWPNFVNLVVLFCKLAPLNFVNLPPLFCKLAIVNFVNSKLYT